MAQIVNRLSDGGETWNLDGTCESAEIPFFVVNPESKAAAIEAAKALAPETYGGLPLSKIRFDGADDDGNFTVVAVYENDDSGDSGGSDDDDTEATVNFDCSAGTRHVSTPIAQVCVYSADNNKEAGNLASAIPVGWNGKTGAESEVAGVDIPIGELRETYTKTMSRTKVMSSTWKKKVARMVGKINAGSFHGWDPGEVMFLGASYAAPLKGAAKVQVSFHFSIHINEKKAKVGAINVGDCDGFEYLWAINSDKVEDGKRVPQVKKIYKAQVCQSADMGSLGV